MAQEEKKIEIGNYDVLVEDNDDGKNLRLYSATPHVGNNRFSVMLTMHKGEFETCLVAGEATEKVVEKLINIVCQKCVPNGRFLRKVADGWTVLRDDGVLEFVRAQLNSSLELPAAEPATTKVVESPAQESPQPLVPKSAAAVPTPPKPSSLPVETDGEKKRRRRSSLLRRSVSEGMLIADSKKKASRTLEDFIEDPSEADGSEHPQEGDEAPPPPPPPLPVRRGLGERALSSKEVRVNKVETAEALDVIFNHRKKALVESHTGNNRLSVLMDVQMEGYQEADEDKQNTIVAEIMLAVTQFWGGRFLAECETTDGYVELDEDQAQQAMRDAFTSRAGEKRPSLVKEETLQALQRFQPAPELGDMRSAALQSLQKRKKRQGLTSKIRNLAAATRTTLTRTTSAPVQQSQQSNTFSPRLGSPRLGLLKRATSSQQPSMQQQKTGSSRRLEPLPAIPDSRPTNFLSPFLNGNRTGSFNNRNQPVKQPSSSNMRLSDFSEGAIEDLLQTLDVSGDMVLPPRGSSKDSADDKGRKHFS